MPVTSVALTAVNKIIVDIIKISDTIDEEIVMMLYVWTMGVKYIFWYTILYLCYNYGQE